MAAFENNFSTLCFFDGLCRFLSVPGNRLPLGMELRKFDAAICYCRCLFFNFHIISPVQWKQAASYASDFTPGQCFCWIQQPADSGESVLCWKTLPALLIPSVFPTCDSACFVLWFCTELQQLPVVPRQWPADILCSLSPGIFHQPFPESWIHGQEMLCASSPCCVLWDRGWLPAQTSGPAMLPGQGLCCWWLQWDGAKKFMESLGNWLFCFVLDFSFWWRFFFSL